MSNGEDLLFRIGFESHPQSGAKMEALAKSVENFQARLDRSMGLVGDRAVAEARRVNAIGSGSGAGVAPGGGASSVGVAGGSGASPSSSGSVREAQYAKELEADRHFRQAIQESGVAQLMTIEQQNEAIKIAGEAKLTVQRQQADQAVILMEQLRKDLDLLQAAGEGKAGGVDIEEVLAANDRVHAMHQQAEEAREREAMAEGKRRKESEKAAKAEARELQKQAKDAERVAKQVTQAEKREADERDRLIRNRRRLIENSRKYEQTLARETAEVAIEAYEDEQKASEQAIQSGIAARRNLLSALGQTAKGIGQLSRSAVLLGLANGEQMEKVIRQLALVQAGIDLVRGGVSVVRGVGQAFEAVRTILAAKVVAEKAAQAAGRLSVAGSAAVTNALNLEALSAQRTAAAHVMLTRARGMGGGAARGVATTVAGRAAGSAVGGVAANVAGGVAGNAVGGAATTVAGRMMASAIGTAVVAGIKSVGGTIAMALGAVLTAPVAAAAAVAVAAGGAAYYVMTKEDRDNASESEEKTKRMEHWSALFQLEQGHLRKLAAIREDFENKREDIDRSTRTARVDDDLTSERTDGGKVTVMDKEIANLKAELATAAAGVRAKTEMDPNTGLDRLSDRGGLEAMDKMIAAQQRLHDAEQKRYGFVRGAESEKRRMQMDEIKGIEDIIRARMQERGELEKSYQTAKERFGALNEMEQKLAIKSLEKARAGGELSRKDIANLGNIGTDEAEGFVRDARIKSADARSYDAVNRGVVDKKHEAIDQANDVDIAKLAAQPGQSEKEIRANLASPVQVDLVNREELVVQMNQNEDRIFGVIKAEMDRLRREQADNLTRRLKEEYDQNVQGQNQQYQGQVAEINANRD